MNIKDLFSLKNHVAVVVGGAGKIAFPMAESFVEADALVYIASTKEESYQSAVKKLQMRA